MRARNLWGVGLSRRFSLWYVRRKYTIYIVKDIRNFVCYNSLYYGINKYSMEVIGKR